MKKLMFILAFVGMTSAVAAQNEVPTEKYSVATNRFWSNWFFTVGGSYNAFYSSQETRLTSDPFESFRRSWGAEFTLGKWYSPVLGVRLKGAGIWGTQVNTRVFGGDIKPAYGDCPTFKNIEFSAQTMFNLNNLFCGYKHRVWNLIPYIGIGVGHHMTAGGAWTPLYQAGINNQFNFGKRVFLNLDIYYQMADADYDGNNLVMGDTRFFSSHDKKVGAALSLGFNLGKVGWEKKPNVAALQEAHAAELAALNSQLGEQEAENNRLKELLKKEQNKKPAPQQTVVKEVLAGSPVSVFFNINSAKVASKKDLVSVKELAEFVIAKGGKLVVKGYADSRTGSAEYNKTLAEKRANTVADELVKMGVARENIVITPVGGDDKLSPYTYNRRATVEIQ